MEKGFYFVKFIEHGKNAEWTVAYHDGTKHLPISVVGSDEVFDENEFHGWVEIKIPKIN